MFEEFETCPSIELTHMYIEWNPSLTSLSEKEDALLDDRGQLLSFDERHHSRWITRLRTSTNESLEKAKRNS